MNPSVWKIYGKSSSDPKGYIELWFPDKEIAYEWADKNEEKFDHGFRIEWWPLPVTPEQFCIRNI